MRGTVRPCAVEDPTHVRNLSCARTGRSPRCPPRWRRGGTRREGQGRKPTMNDSEKSDGRVVPTKPPNNAGSPAAEVVEGRRPAKGNTEEQNAPRTQRRTSAPNALDRVREQQQEKTGRVGSQRSYITSRSTASATRSWRSNARPRPESTASRGSEYGQDLEDRLGSCTHAFIEERTGRSRRGACTSRNRTGGNGRWGSHRWRTRSSSVRSSRCSTRSTRLTSSGSHTGSGPGVASTMRWMRSRRRSGKKVNWVLDASALAQGWADGGAMSSIA